MEISGIGGGFMPLAKPESVSLTEEQKEKVQEIISKYDPENFTKEDFKSLMEELKAADIPRSRDTIDIMKEAGFEPPQGPPPRPMGQGEVSIDSEVKKSLLELLKQYKAGEIDENDFLAKLQDIISGLFDKSGNVVDDTV